MTSDCSGECLAGGAARRKSKAILERLHQTQLAFQERVKPAHKNACL